MYMYAPCMCLVSQRSEEGIRCPGTGVIDGCDSPCGYWKLSPGPLEEQ